MNGPDQQREASLSEIKIKTISNGWILKTIAGWEAFTDIGVMLEAIRAEATRLGAQVRVERKRAVRVEEAALVKKLNTEK